MIKVGIEPPTTPTSRLLFAGLFGGILAGEGFSAMLGNPSPTKQGLVTAIYDIGCALGAVAAFIWGERIGRKRSIILANFIGTVSRRIYRKTNSLSIVIIGAAIQTACYSYAQMYDLQHFSTLMLIANGCERAVARVIAGIGVGLSTVAVPILQSETLPSHNRGALLVVQSALIIIGVAIASWLCFATLFADSSLQWRFPVRYLANITRTFC